jgi:Tfp pilus assembly protein PilX
MELKKAAVLVVVLGIMLILSILALVAVNVMTQESRIAEHKIRRIQAFYAAQAGIVHTLERLRQNNTFDPNLPNVAGSGYTAAITRTQNAGPRGTDVITATVDYTR